jgi:hypothetical protein
MKAWHFTNGDKLRDGRTVPPIGETLVHDGELWLCRSGLHASEDILHALRYATGCMLHRVEITGEIIHCDNKLAATQRTILASADMTWALVEFAEDCAKWAAYDAAYDAADAAYAYAATYAAAAERDHQRKTLELWFECLAGYDLSEECRKNGRTK